MADNDFQKVAEADVEQRERKGGGPASRDLSGALGAQSMTVRTWRFGPGHAMAYHRHATQEEVYHLVSGGPQNMVIDGAQTTVNDGDWLRVGKDTPRRIDNTSDRDGVWIIVGAPPGPGITDGIRLDPATGEAIPRS
jgi:uncharacterized cupin superfamily protein